MILPKKSMLRQVIWAMVLLLVAFTGERWYFAARDVSYVADTFLKPHEATRTIREMLSAGANIRYSRHALERMKQRDISMQHVEEALYRGEVRGNPRQGNRDQEWLYKIFYIEPTSDKQLEVVYKLEDGTIRIITVMWDGDD